MEEFSSCHMSMLRNRQPRRWRPLVEKANVSSLRAAKREWRQGEVWDDPLPLGLASAGR